MNSYASLEDVALLWRPLTPDEQARVTALLPMVSDLLRMAAQDVGKNIDAMIADLYGYESIVKMVTVDVVSRIMRQSTTGEPVSQESQTALGYTWQGTYAIPGGGMAGALMRNDLKRLGLWRQRLGVIDLDPRHHCHADGAYTDRY